jgi:hypothetical protein
MYQCATSSVFAQSRLGSRAGSNDQGDIDRMGTQWTFRWTCNTPTGERRSVRLVA